MQQDLPIIQRTYDLILWLVPHLNKFPRNFKFILADRMQTTLYGFLESLIRARYRREKLELLESLNAELDVLRYQIRLCKDFSVVHADVDQGQVALGRRARREGEDVAIDRDA